MRLRRERTGPVGRAFAGRRLRVALATAAMLGLGLASGAVVAAPANAAASETFQLQNIHVEHCITSNGAKNSNAEVYSCNGSSNQKWHWGTTWRGDYRKLINGDGQCLGIAGGSSARGAAAVVWKCNTSDSQYWYADQDDPTAEGWNLINLNSQMVLQVRCDCTKERAVVDQAPDDAWSSPNQNWFIQA
jgi:hypothetical protein